LYTQKHLDYLDWKKLVSLKGENNHKTAEGLSKMINLKKGMNTGRLLSNNLIKSWDKINIFNISEEDDLGLDRLFEEDKHKKDN
jgi:hypothetical protein